MGAIAAGVVTYLREGDFFLPRDVFFQGRRGIVILTLLIRTLLNGVINNFLAMTELFPKDPYKC